jgi:hypothetical protein
MKSIIQPNDEIITNKFVENIIIQPIKNIIIQPTKNMMESIIQQTDQIIIQPVKNMIIQSTENIMESIIQQTDEIITQPIDEIIIQTTDKSIMQSINETIIQPTELKTYKIRTRAKKYINGALDHYNKIDYHKNYYKEHVKKIICPHCKMTILSHSLKPHQKTNRCMNIKENLLNETNTSEKP